MTPKEIGRTRPSRSDAAGRRPADFPPRRSRRRARARPAQVGHHPARIRRHTRRQAQAMIFDFFAKPVRIRATERRNVSSSSGPSSTRRRRAGTARPTKCPASLVVTASAIRPRRSKAFPMTSAAASSSTKAAGSPIGSTRSAGRGVDRPARSVPTAPTAMKLPTKSPRQCRRKRRRPLRRARVEALACGAAE